MSNVKRFFSAMMMVIVFMVVLVVFSIGYKTFFVDNGHNAMGQSEMGPKAEPAGQNMAGMSEQTKETANAQAMQQMTSNTQAPSYAAPAMSQAGVIQKNREMLDGVIAKLNDTMQYLSMGPNAPDTTKTKDAATVAADEKVQDGQGSDPVKDVSMQDMGLSYDADIMAQLHSGMYKIAVGTALLGQLRDELISLEDSADLNIADPKQYYTTQYDQTVQSKAKLSYALSYLGDTANLVSLNPYVTKDGLSYDSERMVKLHESVLKLAEGLAAASVLENNLSNQAETYAAQALSYANPAASTGMEMASAMPDAYPPSASLTANQTITSGTAILDSINLDEVVNMLPFVFGALFLVGMIGYIFRLKMARSRTETADAEPGKVG